MKLVVLTHNRLYWPLARKLLRLVDFSDGTVAIGWRWGKRFWMVSTTHHGNVA